MNIYYLTNNKYSKDSYKNWSPLYSLTIDPGLVTSGFCLINFANDSVKLKTIETKTNFISSTFMENYQMSCKQFQVYLQTLSEMLISPDLTKFQVNIEHSVYNPEFTFSIGLNIFLTYLVDGLLSLGVPLIKLIPPKTPQYFLQDSSKLKDSEIKRWVKFFMPMFSDKALSPHSRDALLHSLFLHYEFYNKVYKINARLPVIDLIDIRDF